MAVSGELVFAGVSLAQHAGVAAALEEGIPLADVLAQEGIEPSSWRQADRAFRQALPDAPDAYLLYLEKRRIAEDCLGRAIAPLDDDPVAWTGLLAALAGGNAAAQLEPLGLRMTDVARLGRRWRKKAADDPAVAERLGELAGKGKAPTSVTCGSIELRPFPWTSGPERHTRGTAEETEVDAREATRMRLAEARLTLRDHEGRLPIESDGDLWAALRVVEELAPGMARDAYALCGLDARKAEALAATWRERLATESELRANVVVRTADYRLMLGRILAGRR